MSNMDSGIVGLIKDDLNDYNPAWHPKSSVKKKTPIHYVKLKFEYTVGMVWGMCWWRKVEQDATIC